MALKTRIKKVSQFCLCLSLIPVSILVLCSTKQARKLEYDYIFITFVQFLLCGAQKSRETVIVDVNVLVTYLIAVQLSIIQWLL